MKSLTPFIEGLADRFDLSEKLTQKDWNWPGPLPGRDVRIRLIPLAKRLNVYCLFELKQERRVYDIWTREGAHLEVSADRVCLAGVECTDVLQRLEVELRNGLPASLIQFASDLRHTLGLKPAGDSKFTFGLRATGLSLPVLSGKSLRRIRPGDTMRKAAARALKLGFRQMLWHLPGTRLGVDSTYLHDMRVSIRRLRAVLRLFRGALPPRTSEKLAHELKWLGRSLGAVRDLDVHRQECRVIRLQRSGASHPADGICRQAMILRVMTEIAAAPDGAAMVSALGGCVANWHQEQFIRRAAFADAWKAFDRKKPRRQFLKTLRHYERR